LGVIEQRIVDDLGSPGCRHLAEEAIAGRVWLPTRLLDPSDETVQQKDDIDPERSSGDPVTEVLRDAQRHILPFNGDDHSLHGRGPADNQLAGMVGRDVDH
jgi:hypothetical protein